MNLFENAGTKIRRWAEGLFIIETIGAVIGGLILMFSDEDMFLIGLLTMIAGILVAFITSLFLSAFGELVEGTTENKKINAQILSLMEQKGNSPKAAAPVASAAAAPVAPKAEENKPKSWFCTACGERNPAEADCCGNCGKTRAAAPKAAPAIPETWRCGNCGTENSKNYYQCKKCGAMRSSG